MGRDHMIQELSRPHEQFAAGGKSVITVVAPSYFMYSNLGSKNIWTLTIVVKMWNETKYIKSNQIFISPAATEVLYIVDIVSLIGERVGVRPN